MITKVLSQKLVLLAIGLAAGSGILIPASYGSFHPVTSSEIQDGTIQSIDIGTSQVKAADIATDAVGASEFQGVTKLLFGQCKADTTEGTTLVGAGGDLDILCNISGVDADDSAIAMRNSGNGCFEVYEALRESNLVRLAIRNECPDSATLGTGADFSIIVFDK